MQAAQIDPAKTYALEVRVPKTESTIGRSYIARFYVLTVESLMKRRKLKPTSADYEHKVHGRIDERDVPADLLPPEGEERHKYLFRAVEPSEIEDEYTKYQELKAREADEKAKAITAEKARNQKAADLVALFYQFTGLEQTVKKYEAPFAASYSGGIGISEAGVAALLKVLTPYQPSVDK